jgi:hypothetical protein
MLSEESLYKELFFLCIVWYIWATVAQAVQCLTTGWAIEVRSQTEAEDFSSSPCIQTGSGAHPTSYPMGTGVLSPGVKRGQGVTLITNLHLVPRLSMSRSYTSSPPCASMACCGTPLPFDIYISTNSTQQSFLVNL